MSPSASKSRAWTNWLAKSRRTAGSRCRRRRCSRGSRKPCDSCAACRPRLSTSSSTRRDCRTATFGSRISPAGWRGAAKRLPCAAASSGSAGRQAARKSSRPNGSKSPTASARSPASASACRFIGWHRHRGSIRCWSSQARSDAGFNSRSASTAALRRKPHCRSLTSGHASTTTWPNRPAAPRGWFLHVGAKNVIVTHVEPIADDRPGVRLRLLETEGLDTRTKLSAYRPFLAARSTDFRGQPTGVLSVVDGQVQFDIGPHRWMQIEAEW